jgi:hypothetical protein
MAMPEPRDYRNWAARVARQAGNEPDANEAQRLMSFVKYWEKLAATEEWQHDSETQH